MIAIPHYTITEVDTTEAMDYLREVIPGGIANSMNFCLFSTDGVHGSCWTIEDFENGVEGCSHITFLVVQPRRVQLTYGNVIPKDADIAFLKLVRETSHAAVAKIGLPEQVPER